MEFELIIFLILFLLIKKIFFKFKFFNLFKIILLFFSSNPEIFYIFNF